MEVRSSNRLFYVFAASALLVLFAVGGVIASVRLINIRSTTEQDAAEVATRSLTPALNTIDLNDSGALSSLIGGELTALRVWDSSGNTLSSAGLSQAAELDDSALRDAGRGETSVSKAGSPSGDVLVSYAPLGLGTVIEIQQDYAPIGASVSGSRYQLFLLLGVSGVVLALALPAIFWKAQRKLRGEHSRLLYLYRTGQAMRSTLELSDVLEHLSRDAAIFTGSQLALAALVEEESNDLIIQASYDQQADATAQHHRQVEEWFLRRCAGTGQPVFAALDGLPYLSLLGYEPALHGPLHLIAAPIHGRERVIGVLTLVRVESAGEFTAAELQVLQEMAAQGAMAIEQAALFAKVRRYADEIEMSYDTTLKVLTAALDTKDAATRGHSERVAKTTLALAREMGVPKERLVDIERGALLHDVGKIGVPDEVLTKPAELNELEWEAMRKHPLLAGLLVSKVGFLEGSLPILLYHHERFDGTGYPFGLAGQAIPLEARIFAIVDAYDAMTSDRPYRDALPPADVLEEIRKNAGLQFDPDVVEAFTRIIADNDPALQLAS